MENKILYSKNFDKKIESIKVAEEALTIVLEDKQEITFSTYHDQDCCESVYGDFSIVEYHESELKGKDLKEIKIKSIKDMGFLICFDFEYDRASKIFIACYNYQNGYYSSELILTINDNGTKTTIDVSDCVEEHVD